MPAALLVSLLSPELGWAQVTITSGPSGAPNPVVSGGSVALAVGAGDAGGSTLTYAWSATCGGGLTGGAFAPNTSVARPQWTAPVNSTGAAQSCAIAVTVSNSSGQSTTGSYSQAVLPASDTVTIRNGPYGTPTPVPPGGTTSLSVTASDSAGHALNYVWLSYCPMLGAGGTFSNRNIPTPTWTAPANSTGMPQQCSITVTINDGLGHSAAGQFVQLVTAPGAHAVTITAGPTGSPDPVTSGGSISLYVVANDNQGHPLSYLWQALCEGNGARGTFTAATSPNTTWIAPANLSGLQQRCRITTLVHDSRGQLLQPMFSVYVDPALHTLNITSGPTIAGLVPSGGATSVSAGATDSLGNGAAYAWSASCPALGGNGSFSSGGASATWTAPINATGAQQTCTVTVSATSGALRASKSVAVRVDPSGLSHTLTLVQQPAGNVNPVPSGGSSALSALASDSLGHGINYQWSAACPSLASGGTFSSPLARTPVWTAPANTTGAQQACTIRVTATDSTGQLNASGAFTALVSAVVAPHTLTLTSGPVGTPNPVASGGTAALSVAATDSAGHAVSYTWTATCTGGLGAGTFSPSAVSRTPAWIAPPNSTGLVQTCMLNVTASDGLGQVAYGSLPQRVAAAAVVDTVTITRDPVGTPNPVASSGSVTMGFSASDSAGHALAYSWTATCSGGIGNGVFSPNASVSNPVWTAPANSTGATQWCAIGVTASDGLGHSAARAFTEAVTSVAAPSDTVTITSGPAATPTQVTSGGTATLAVTAVDSASHPLTYSWTASCPALGSGGTFVNGGTRTPQWLAPTNTTGNAAACSVYVTVRDAYGHAATGQVPMTVSATAPATHTVTITAGPTARPSPVAPGGAVSLSVAAADSQGHPLLYFWQAVCDGAAVAGRDGSFTRRDVATTTWMAPANVAVEQRCRLSVLVHDMRGALASQFMELIVRRGASADVPSAAATPEAMLLQEFAYYFAEGATVNGFDTRFDVLNADSAQAAAVTAVFQIENVEDPVTYRFTVPAHGRATVDVRQLAAANPDLAALSSAAFSTVIRSDRALVADRTMTWNGSGSHTEAGVGEPASEWYLAEGATIGTLELYYTIQNPNAVALDNEVDITYLLPPPLAPVVRTYSVGPSGRATIAVHADPELADAEVAAIVRTPEGKPVIVERSMYLSNGTQYTAGHNSAAVRSPQSRWFFAEGVTGGAFDFFLLVANPNADAAHVTTTFLFDDGTSCSESVTVDAQSRHTMAVDALELPGCARSLADAVVSTVVTSDMPVVAERTMWWRGASNATWDEAHNAAGATEPGVRWAVASGEQGGSAGHETYILIGNTSAYSGTARVTVLLDDGSGASQDVALPPGSRVTVAAGVAAAQGGFGETVANKRFSVTVESLPAAGQSAPAQIVVERATYTKAAGSNGFTTGTDVAATKLQ
jgi:hypothetical protein